MKFTEPQWFIISSDALLSVKVLALLDLAGITQTQLQADITGLSIGTVRQYRARSRRLSEAARRG